MIYGKMSLPIISRERRIGHKNAFTKIKCHTKIRAKKSVTVMQTHWSAVRDGMKVFEIYWRTNLGLLMINTIQIISMSPFLPNVGMLLNKFQCLLLLVLITLWKMRSHGQLIWNIQEEKLKKGCKVFELFTRWKESIQKILAPYSVAQENEFLRQRSCYITNL